MSIVTSNYFESKKLGERLGWSSDQIHDHANEKTQAKIAEITRELVDAFNSSASQDVVITGMLEGITTSHRFLQTEFINGLIKLFDQYAELDERYFDGRNQAYKYVCDRMAKAAYKDTDR